MKKLANQPALFEADDVQPAKIRFDRAIFGALCEALEIDWRRLTPHERSIMNRATHELIAAQASPDEVAGRVRNYCLHFPGMSITPTAIVKHWAQCEHPPAPRPSRQQVEYLLGAVWATGESEDDEAYDALGVRAKPAAIERRETDDGASEDRR